MGFFDHFHKDGSAALKPQILRTKRTVVRSTPDSRTITPTAAKAPSLFSQSASRAVSGEKPDLTARRVRKRVSAAQQRLVSSTDESESDGMETQPRKRERT